MEHANKVQGLKVKIEEVTIFVRVNNEQQGIPTEDMIESVGRNSCGQGKASLTNLEAIRDDYAKVIRRNRMLEDNYMGMIATTITYTMRKRALMDKLEKLKSLYKQWPNCGLLFTSWLPVNFMIMYPNGLPINEQHEPSIN